MNKRGGTFVLLAFWVVSGLLAGSAQEAARPGEVAWSVKYDPKTLDPAKVDDQVSEMVRYLTGGVLLRVNRSTQRLEPALAADWSTTPDGRTVTFHLRTALQFSDGSPLTSSDVLATLKRVLDPSTAAPVAEEFLAPTEVTVEARGPLTVVVHLPKRVASIGKVFDEIAIQPASAQGEGRVTSGSYTIAEYRRGEYLRLARNSHYWRHDATGVQLPYLASLKVDILANGEQDELRFARGQYQLLNSIPPDDYGVLASKAPGNVHDLGAALNTEQMWFNQAAAAPLPAWEKAWFQSRGFRMAVAQAIHREDLVRIAYAGHATPANGFISPANTFWHDAKLQPIHEDANASMQLLAKEGFRMQGKVLVDGQGHAVKFSIVTNAGNRSREKMAALIQQDLAALGMQVNVVTLDFPALIDRLMHTQAYEAAMLGLSNVEPDPSSMMNVWLSSSPNHQWNPAEKTPATAWEAEMDRQMLMQAAAVSDAERKRAVDRVQEIVAEEQPFIYLVYPNMLYGSSASLAGVAFPVLAPGVISNIDWMRWKGAAH